MRILLLTQWFQPEPNFKGLPLAKALRARGHDVEVLTGFPNYPGGKLYPGYRIKFWNRETMDGIVVNRTILYPSHDQSALRRILNYTSFAISSMLFSFWLRRPDVVYVYCPPMTAAAGAIALRIFRKVPYVIDIQDLWPDTVASTGMVKSGLIMRLVGAWSAFAMRHANALIVLSPGFKRRLLERQVACPIHVIPNWAPPEIEEQAKSLPAKTPSNGTALNILFAGNMGKAQALETVISAAQRLICEAPLIRFTFIGDGVDVEALRAASRAAGAGNIVFLPSRRVTDMAPVFAEADALLVHLRDDPLFLITIPSKTQAYLAMGRPILMGVKGDAADMVKAAAAGITFEPENADSLAEAAIALSRMSSGARAEMGRAGAAYYQQHLSFERGTASLEKVLAVTAATANEPFRP